MKTNDRLDYFSPEIVPNLLVGELRMKKDEAWYWTYDLFKANIIIPKKENQKD